MPPQSTVQATTDFPTISHSATDPTKYSFLVTLLWRRFALTPTRVTSTIHPPTPPLPSHLLLLLVLLLLLLLLNIFPRLNLRSVLEVIDEQISALMLK